MSAKASDVRATLLQWWKDPGDYWWLVSFLDSRHLLTWFKRFMAALGLLLAALAGLMQIAPTIAHGWFARVVLVLVLVIGLTWGVRWWFGQWPSPRESLVLVVCADAGITLAVAMHTDAISALASTPLFATVGAYIVFFHTPKVQAWHVALVTVTIIGVSVWVIRQHQSGGLALAVAKGGVALLLTFAVMPVIQLGFWLVQHSTVDSLTDPLTRLTNRRGLNDAIDGLQSTDDPQSPLSALIIDLDDFKGVNDRNGHLVGDAVLVRTADCLRACTGASAVVARLGGEEFLVLDRLRAAEAERVGECIRGAIAAPGEPIVTASIGVATAEHLDQGGVLALLGAADAAMYEAKRLGGNQLFTHSDGVGRQPIQQ
jgi:diguanylate cyclase (GGDEF)-like protein